MRVDRLLVEGKLTKDQVDDLTDAWFAIKEAPLGTELIPGTNLFNVLKDLDKKLRTYKKPDGTKGTKLTERERREEYDKLYDAATDIVFDNVKTVKGYDGVKEYMRRAWLKMGFEAGDGNDKTINLVLDLLNRSSLAPAEKIVPYIIENFNAIDDYLVGNNKAQDSLKNLLMTRTDLWKSYSTEDITKIIGSIYKLLSNAKSDADRQKVIDAIKNTNNLRDVISMKGSQKKNNTITVNKVNSNTSSKQQKQILKNVGWDIETPEGRKSLQNLISKEENKS